MQDSHPTDRTDPTDPAAYRWWTTEHTRFSDTDLVGHINNVSHVALIETARVRYAMDLAGRVEISFGSLMFVRLEVDFRDDLFWPTEVRCGGRVLALGNSSFRLGVGVFDGDRCVTTSENVMVFLGEDKRPVRVPDPLREVLAQEIGQ